MTNTATTSTGNRQGKRRQPGAIRRTAGFVIWIVSGFGLIPLILRGRRAEQVVVYTVHPSFYLWLLIAAGFAGAMVSRHWPGAETWLGWAYMWVVLYTIVTILFDLNTSRFLFWLFVFCFLWLACKYIEDLKNIPVVTDIVRYFKNLRPRFDPGTAMAISTLLTPAWIGSLVHSFTEGKKTFSPNSIEERYVGHGTDVTDRSGLKFRARYRDIFESLLGFGAADLEAVNNDGTVVRRWNNILFLTFTWRKLDEILHQRAAVVDNAPENPVEIAMNPIPAPAPATVAGLKDDLTKK